MPRPPLGFVTNFQTVRDTYETMWRDPLTPTERRVFFDIAANPGASNAQIVERTGLKPEQVSRAMGKVIAYGWVISRDGVGDRRVRRFGLSERGLDEVARAVSLVTGRTVRSEEVQGVEVWDPDGPT